MTDSPEAARELVETGYRVAPAELVGQPAPSRPAPGIPGDVTPPAEWPEPLEEAMPVEAQLEPQEAALAPVVLSPAAVLGPGASQRELKARLRQLRQPIYGSKEVLWARLQRAEREHAERVALDRAIRARAEERMAGEAPEE
eukprot:9163259-Lingulodinium_polyedra.AAC.1